MSIWIRNDGYTITTDKQVLQPKMIHEFLSQESYWAKGIAPELVVKSIENASLCYGVFTRNPYENSHFEQVGFARVMTDYVRFAYLSDVFIVREHRKKELSKWLIETIINHPFLKGVSFSLATKDAHKLYERFGFEPIDSPQNRLQRPLDWDVIHQAYKLPVNTK